MNEEDTSTNTQGAHTPPTEPVAAGQVLILTGDPGDKAIALLPNGQEMAVATIREDAAQAAFVVPRGCGRVRLDCADRGRCSLVAVPASFSAALFGSSAEGGGTSPVQSGLAYLSSMPSVLLGNTVHDIGQCPAILDLSAVVFEWNGRVETAELWLTLPSGNAPVITFPAAWAWMDGVPSINTPGISYRIVIRREPFRIVANLAY